MEMETVLLAAFVAVVTVGLIELCTDVVEAVRNRLRRGRGELHVGMPVTHPVHGDGAVEQIDDGDDVAQTHIRMIRDGAGAVWVPLTETTPTQR